MADRIVLKIFHTISYGLICKTTTLLGWINVAPDSHHCCRVSSEGLPACVNLGLDLLLVMCAAVLLDSRMASNRIYAWHLIVFKLRETFTR